LDSSDLIGIDYVVGAAHLTTMFGKLARAD